MNFLSSFCERANLKLERLPLIVKIQKSKTTADREFKA